MKPLVMIGLLLLAGCRIAMAADTDPEPVHVEKYRAEVERQRQAAITEMAAKLADVEEEYARQKDDYDSLKRGTNEEQLKVTVGRLKYQRDWLRAELDKLRRNDPPFEPTLPTFNLDELAASDLGEFPATGAVEYVRCRGGNAAMRSRYRCELEYTLRVSQILSASEMVVGIEAYRQSIPSGPLVWDDTEIVWIRGIPTAEYREGHRVELPGAFCVTGMDRFYSVDGGCYSPYGGTQIMLVLEKLSPSMLRPKTPESQPVDAPLVGESGRGWCGRAAWGAPAEDVRPRAAHRPIRHRVPPGRQPVGVADWAPGAVGDSSVKG